jgi:hypothetical protein
MKMQLIVASKAGIPIFYTIWLNSAFAAVRPAENRENLVGETGRNWVLGQLKQQI